MTGMTAFSEGHPDRRRTLGTQLESHRLEHRLLRLTTIVGALHARAERHQLDLGRSPRQLRAAIADFEAERTRTRARLAELAPPEGVTR